MIGFYLFKAVGLRKIGAMLQIIGFKNSALRLYWKADAALNAAFEAAGTKQ